MLLVDGQVTTPRDLTRDDLASLKNGLVEDVSRLDPRRQGRGVQLAAVLESCGIEPKATHVTLHSADGFSASVPLADVVDVGLLLFECDGEPLPESAGGPVRFLVPNAAACKTAEVDACANVKHVSRIELTTGPGRDTR